MPQVSTSSASGPAGGVVVSGIDWSREREDVVALFHEFHAFLGREHNFDAAGILEEARALPGLYAASISGLKGGAVLLARVEGKVAGCFCLKPFESHMAEAKRMYIRPEYRGLGLGSKLLDAVMEEARAQGYRRLLLDSLRSLPDAHRLYYKRGFTLIPPYNELPTEIALHMACAL